MNNNTVSSKYIWITLVLTIFVYSVGISQNDCATATNIGVVGSTTHCFDPSTVDFTATMASATSSGAADGSCDGIAGANVDYWYQFTTLTTGEIQIYMYYSTGSPANVVIWSGACGALTEEDCFTGQDILHGQVSTLSPNSTYYLQVLNDAGDTPLNNMQFCIQESVCSAAAAAAGLADPANDNCLNATALDVAQPFYGTTACGYTLDVYTTGFISDDACLNSGGNFIIFNSDAWYSFVAGSTSVELDYEISNCFAIDDSDGVELLIFDVGCGMIDTNTPTTTPPIYCSTSDGLTPVDTDPTISLTGLTVGNTYLMMIDGISLTGCFYSFTPSTGIAVLPPNDDCDDATVLTCGNNYTGNATIATNTDAPANCGGVTTGEGVWFTYAGDGSDVTISTDEAGTDAGFDTALAVYSGPCASLTCVGGDDNSGTGTTSTYTFSTVNGTDYYIYLTGTGLANYELSINCVSCNANAGDW